MEDIIRIEDVSYEYPAYEDGTGGVAALKDIKLNIEGGSFVAVLGMNGCGKSTLAKNLNALLVPSRGRIFVGGMDTSDESLVWDVRRTAGMVFQNPDNQIVSAIIEDDVAFGPENIGIPTDEIRSRIDDAMKSTGIYDLRGQSAAALSGGQKQRVAISGVLAMRPRCIVFDEPTAMLDPSGRAEVMQIIKKLHRDGITVILITHFMEEAAEADRVIVMKDGRVAADRAPAVIFSRTSLIHDANLKLPPALDIIHYLRTSGVEIPEGILTLDELAEEIGHPGHERARSLIPIRMKRIYESACGSFEQTDEVVIRAENLCHTYSKGLPGERVALKDVSFEIRRGEIVGIIGHTGSGKSTLMQHLNGLLKCDSGRTFIGDIDITRKGVKMADIRKRVGLVFQYPEYQLFEETVAKDVAFGPSNLGLEGEELDRCVRDAIALVGLDYDELADRSPLELSGGQKRRVAIAGVIAMNPEILILDEPTAGLDPASHREILELIKHIRQVQGSTVLMVTHNMDDAAAMCSRLLVMKEGQLVLNGSPEEVFSHADMLKGAGLGLPAEAELLYRISNGL